MAERKFDKRYLPLYVYEKSVIWPFCNIPDPATVKEVARCGELLPPVGKNTIYSCNRNVSESFEETMLQAAQTFCEREDVRDWLFLCWEKGLSDLYDIAKEEVDAKNMNEFQVCLQGILDKLFDE